MGRVLTLAPKSPGMPEAPKLAHLKCGQISVPKGIVEGDLAGPLGNTVILGIEAAGMASTRWGLGPPSPPGIASFLLCGRCSHDLLQLGLHLL